MVGQRILVPSTGVRLSPSQPVPTIAYVARSSSGLGRRPLKAEITSSNLVRATNFEFGGLPTSWASADFLCQIGTLGERVLAAGPWYLHMDYPSSLMRQYEAIGLVDGHDREAFHGRCWMPSSRILSVRSAWVIAMVGSRRFGRFFSCVAQ